MSLITFLRTFLTGNDMHPKNSLRLKRNEENLNVNTNYLKTDKISVIFELENDMKTIKCYKFDD